MIDLARRLELKPSQLSGIISYIKSYKPTRSELISITGFSNSYLKKFGKVMSPYLVGGNRWILNEKGEKLLDKIVTGSEVTSSGVNFKEIEEKLELFRKDLPMGKREYDQFRATPGTVLDRVRLIHEHDDLYGREIIFLGDNDLTSVAVSLTGLPKSVTVLDIDDEVLDTISEISKTEGLNIKTIKHDLRNRVKRSLEDRFEVVFSDPPFTQAGFSLFLQRSLDVAEDTLASSIYICYGTSQLSRERSLAIQKIISEAGLLITYMKASFNEYIGAESIGSRSDIYLLGKTSQTKKRVYSKMNKDKIYTHQ